MSWLATDPTGTGDPDILLVGDYNSYAMEDPITAIKNAGYTNLIASLLGPDAYSYVFDGQWGYLDHALASASMTSLRSPASASTTSTPTSRRVLDYNTDFKTREPPDHPVRARRVPGVRPRPGHRRPQPEPAPTVDAGGPYSVFAGFSVAVSASGSDPDGGSLTYAWDLDNNGSFETPGQSATFSAASISTPGPRTIKVRVTDAGGLTAVDTATVNVVVTYDSLCALTEALVTKASIAHALCVKLENAEAAAARGNLNARDGMLKAYRNQLDAQTGKSVSAADAALLKALSLAL